MGSNLQSQKDKLQDELKKVRSQIQKSLQKEDSANNPNYPSASVIHVDRYTHLDTHSPLQGKPERQHQKFLYPIKDPNTGKINPYAIWNSAINLLRLKNSSTSLPETNSSSKSGILSQNKSKKTRRELIIIRRHFFLILIVFVLILWGLFLIFLKR